MASKSNTQVAMPLRFSDLAEVNPRTPVVLPDDAEISFIPMADVNETGHWVNRQVRRLADVKTGYTVFQEGDILFAKITPCAENGKGCHATGLVKGIGFGSTEFHVLRAKSGVNPRIVFHLAQDRFVRAKAGTVMGGSAGQQRVPADFFKLFHLPPGILADQNRKVNLLDAVDDAIEIISDVITQTRQVKSALLHDLLNHGLPGKKTKFRQVRLGDVFIERREKGIEGLPVMSVTASGLVRRDSLDRRVESDLRPDQHLLVRKGDIAYNMMRMWQGVFGLADFDGFVSPAYVVVTPTQGMRPLYAKYLFEHPATVHLFHLYSQGIVEDRLRLYFEQFRSIPLRIVAEEKVQQQIADALMAVDTRIATLSDELTRMSDLKSALSQVLLTGAKITINNGK
jgi:restriction endonuclease S subunit